MDESSTFSWNTDEKKIKIGRGGFRFQYYRDEWQGHQVSVLEFDGKFSDIQELVAVEQRFGDLPDIKFGTICDKFTKTYGDPPTMFEESDVGIVLPLLLNLKKREIYLQKIAAKKKE